MARTSNITFGQVAQIADAMKAAGNRPTARAVRERIGSGSMGTIHKLLQQWAGKGGSESDENDAPELPSSIASTLMDFVSTQVAEACEPLNDELKTAKEEAEHLATENERLESVIERLHTERDNAQSAQTTSKALYDRAEKTVTETLEHNERLKNGNNELLRIMDGKDRELAKYEGLDAENCGLVNERNHALNHANDAEKRAAVLAAQLDAKNEQVHELLERLKTAESRVNTQSEELKQANNHYQACAARLEAAAREIAYLRATKIKTAPAPKKTAPKKNTNANT